MAFSLTRWVNNIFERNTNGDYIYYPSEYTNWSNGGSNLSIAQNHPILTPAMLFVSKLYSQPRFWLENTKTKKIITDHWLLNLLKNPNPYQTGKDLLETQMFFQIAQGKAVGYLKSVTGVSEADSLYILNSDLIEFPENFKTPIVSNRIYDKKYANQTILYDRDGENLKIKIKDLLFFYDMPNMGNRKNFFRTQSRLDGLEQTLINTKDSLLAKNIILKSNGKELVTGEKSGFPLTPDEKENVEKLFNNKYGLSLTRKRGIITKSSLKWQSLHIALRDLGLDESVKVDGNLIYTALHIPKDILSLEAKKTTYNNFKESMVSYIQNEIQSSLDATIDVFQKLIKKENLVLKGNYDHLPVMQFILMEKYDGLSKRAKALNDLLRTGIPQEDALELTGFDRNLKLGDIQQIQGNGNNNQNQGQQNNNQGSSGNN